MTARKIVKAPILDLKPTQFAVGFVEIDEKVKELKKLRANARRKKIAKKLAKKPLDRDGKRGLREAVRRGYRLARLPAARKLPGYVGRGQ